MNSIFSPQLKVALVHDWLTGYRGGEKVLEALCKLFPTAPLYTLVHIKGSVPATIEDREIHTSFLQNMPFGKSKYRHYLPLFPLAAETLVRKEYDVVISTSHAVAKSVRIGKARHWCYIHSPMRYVWDRFDDYFGKEQVGELASQFFFKPITNCIANYDRSTADRVHQYVANSHFVADRVKRFYDRNAEVIAPPVDTNRFSSVVRKPEDHYLFFSALVPYKKADLAIEACQKARKKLFVLGGGPELKRLKKMAHPDFIKFIERPSDDEVIEHFSKARALIFPAVEDFGIIPVEALSAGLPVIGLKEGGLLDSQDDQTCEFFGEQTTDSLISAISRFENRASCGDFAPELLRKKAQEFSNENFEKKIIQSLKSFSSQNFLD